MPNPHQRGTVPAAAVSTASVHSRHDPYSSTLAAHVCPGLHMAVTAPPHFCRVSPPPYRRPERAPTLKARARVVARLLPADAGTHAVVQIWTSASVERATVAAALSATATAEGTVSLDLRELSWPRDTGTAGHAVVAIAAASVLAAAPRLPLTPRSHAKEPPSTVTVEFGTARESTGDPDDEGATVTVTRWLSSTPSRGLSGVPAGPLPRYVWADPKTHVWLAVGQVGFGFADDQAAVSSMLDTAAATTTGGVTVLAASNVPMKRGRGRSGLWHVLVSHGDAAALLARHRCVRFLTDSTYACFDTPGDAAACDEAGMKAPVTIELMRGPVPAHIRSNANAAVDATAVPAHALPRYVWANAKTHVWLAVGQVGFGFAGDDAAVCSMLRRAVASQPLGVPRTQAAGTTVTATAATATTTTKTASAAADANATATDVRSRAAALQKEFPLLTAADVNEFLEGVLAAAQPVTTEAEGRALGIIVAGRRNAAVEADSVVCDGLRACDAAVRERLREVATASNAAPSTHDTGARAPRQLSFADDDPAVRNMLRGLAPHPLGAHIR